MTEYTCDSFRFFNLFPVYFGGKGTDSYSVAEFFSSGKAPVYFTLTCKRVPPTEKRCGHPVSKDVRIYFVD